MEDSFKTIFLTVQAVLTICMLVITIMTVGTCTIPAICILVLLTYVTLYGFCLYKIPHGNTLRYAMLIQALAVILSDVFAPDGTKIVAILSLISAALIAFCAGRLDRIEQNTLIFMIIEVALIISSVIGMFSFFNEAGVLLKLRIFSYPVSFTTIMISYFVRYKEHREAGFIEDKK